MDPRRELEILSYINRVVVDLNYHAFQVYAELLARLGVKTVVVVQEILLP